MTFYWSYIFALWVLLGAGRRPAGLCVRTIFPILPRVKYIGWLSEGRVRKTHFNDFKPSLTDSSQTHTLSLSHTHTHTHALT